MERVKMVDSQIWCMGNIGRQWDTFVCSLQAIEPCSESLYNQVLVSTFGYGAFYKTS